MPPLSGRFMPPLITVTVFLSIVGIPELAGGFAEPGEGLSLEFDLLLPLLLATSLAGLFELLV